MASQTAALLQFEVARALRNKGVLIISVLVPALVYAGNANSGNSAIDGLAFNRYFLASMTVHAAVTAAVVIGGPIPHERHNGWTHLLRTASTPPTAYLAAKLATGALLAIGPATFIAALGVATAGIAPSTAIAVVATAIAGSIPFAALGLVIGYLVTERAMPAAMPATIVVLTVAGGLFWPQPAMPESLRAFSRLVPTSHLAALTRDLLAGHTPAAGDAAALAAFAALCATVLGLLYRRDQTNITTAR